jgi:hypothetical protein
MIETPCGARARLKIESTVGKRKAFLAVQPARTPESDALSRDLSKRGFKFVGSTIGYAFMEAVGMVMAGRAWLLFVLAALTPLGLAGCSHDGPVRFEFVHRSGADVTTFTAIAIDTMAIAAARAELAKPEAERRLHPNGPLQRGAGGHNAPWSWHFIENEWVLAETSIEVCDATPRYVEEHLDEWLRTVGRYCPWTARLSRELDH